MRRLQPLSTLALAMTLAGCSESQPPSWRLRSSTSIALTADGSTLWVASPDDDRVVAIDPETLLERRVVPIVGGPASVAVGPEGRLVVARSLGSSVAVIDGEAVRDIPVPCGGLSAVIWPGETA